MVYIENVSAQRNREEVSISIRIVIANNFYFLRAYDDRSQFQTCLF